MDLDPSIRASGMGRASGAVFWDAPNAWANPALLGYQRGLRYEWGSTQLVPDLATDVKFESEIWKFGVGGLGFSASGNPVGRINLDLGSSQGSDDQGNPTGTFSSGEEVESWGFGISAFELAEQVVGLFGGEMPRWSRVADVSFGMNTKHLDMTLDPIFTGSTTAHDYGVLARVTAMDHHEATGGVPLRLDLAYGYSVLSYDDAGFQGLTRFDPVSRHHRNAFAARTTVDWPESEAHHNGFVRWFMTGLEPMASLGLAYDFDHVTAGDNTSSAYDASGGGAELTLLNCVTFRAGHYDDREGEIHGATWGWSAGLPLGRGAGIRYDWASVPETSGLSDVHREGVTAYLCLRDVVKAMRGE
jgi:hypothetical protein